MKRRRLILAGGGFLAAALAAYAQAPKLSRRTVAVLHPGAEAANRMRVDAFVKGLKAAGYVEGPDFAIELHWGGDRPDRLESLAGQIVARKPTVIVTASSAAIRACKKATSTIPIVFASGANPVEQGFVASLRRPGGNITGIIFHPDLEGKIVEVVRETLPAAQRLGVLIHERDEIHRIQLALIQPASKRLNLEPVVVRIAGAEELDRAFGELAARKADALLLPSQVLFASQAGPIAARALKARLPVFTPHSSGAENGGLISYGTLAEENYRRAAVLVDQILRGAKPGDLPIELPQRFHLVVNAKTAKAIGTKIPPAIMLRADTVIE